MHKIAKLSLILALFFLTQTALFGQNNTNSPYTRFGYGDISDNNSGEQRAMGGLSLGMRSKTSINTANPASYSSVDSLTFMFDMGVSMLSSRFSEVDGRSNKLNANLEYITMQIPLWKNVGFSAGLLPYSFTGYSFYSTSDLPYELYPDTVTATQSFYGNGGVNQVYSGISVNLFNHISVGVNAYYMFGSVINTRALTFSQSDFYSSYQKDSITINSFRFRYGVQFYNTFNKVHDLTLGFIYEPKKKLNANYTEMTASVEDIYTVVPNDDNQFEMPEVYGAGLGYKYKNSLTLGVDYSMQKWGDALYFGKIDSLANRSKLVVGGEYVKNPLGRKYSDLIRYRAGFNISDPYYKVGGATQPKSFGISFGLGLPILSNNTLLNTTFEYGKIGSTGSLREDYFKFTLNIGFNENWFFKRKL